MSKPLADQTRGCPPHLWAVSIEYRERGSVDHHACTKCGQVKDIPRSESTGPARWRKQSIAKGKE